MVKRKKIPNLHNFSGRLIPIFQALDSPRKTFTPDCVSPVALSLTTNHSKIIRLHNQTPTGSVLVRFPIPPPPSFLLNNAKAEDTLGRRWDNPAKGLCARLHSTNAFELR